jgi:hypothetical protein
LAVAAAGCRSHESFDDVAETWGVDLREAVAARFPGACVSPRDPENGEHATSCPIMLTGDTCSVKCDEGYAKQSGSLVSRCADGAYAPAVCASAAATPAVGANGGAPPTTPTTADVDAKKADASEKRAAADEKRAAAEDIRDDLLTSVADAKDRRLAEVLANAALAGAASVSVVRFPLAADDEDAACDDAFATMRVDAAEGACDVSLYGSGRRLLATYDVSVYLDPARVNATALEAAVQNLRDGGLAPATETSDPVAALASIPGIDSGILVSFVTFLPRADAAEKAAAIAAKAAAEKAAAEKAAAEKAAAEKAAAEKAAAEKAAAEKAAAEQSCDETLKGWRDEGYRGCQTKTVSGRTCQNWDSQSPHRHSRYSVDKGSAGNNYCRNPDGEPTIWCYTTDPNKRWELCEPLQ